MHPPQRKGKKCSVENGTTRAHTNPRHHPVTARSLLALGQDALVATEALRAIGRLSAMYPVISTCYWRESIYLHMW